MPDLSELLDVLEKSRELEVKGKYQEADRILSSALERAEEFQDPIISTLYNQRGIVRRMLEEYDASFADYESALKANPPKPQKALAYTNMADIYRVARSDFGAAHKSLDKAHESAEENSLMQAKAIDQRGLVLIAEEGYDMAINCYKQAREICESLLESEPENNDVRNRFAQTVHHLGVAYVLSGKPKLVEEAYESQITALSTFVRLGDQQGIVNAVTTLGQIAMIKEDSKNAILQYGTAWEILEKTGYKRGITSLALNLAETHLQRAYTIGAARSNREPERAIPYLDRFTKEVLKKGITPHDISLMKNQFDKVYRAYTAFELKVDNFDKLKPIFK